MRHEKFPLECSVPPSVLCSSKYQCFHDLASQSQGIINKRHEIGVNSLVSCKSQHTWKALLMGEASWLMAEAAAMAWGESAGASMATKGSTPSASQTRSPVFCWGVPFARSCSAHAAPVSAPTSHSLTHAHFLRASEGWLCLSP